MRRRTFLRQAVLATAAWTPSASILLAAEAQTGTNVSPKPEPASATDWLGRWEKNILSDARNRYCDREMGEELGWLVSPFLNGFYYGYRATGDVQWLERLVDWADAWIQRGVKEPDGFIGWPKAGTGGMVAEKLFTDSLLGEAMALRPVVLMADTVLKTKALQARFGTKAESYLKLANATFDKWLAHGCWRETGAGGVWVVPAFGIDRATGRWTQGYERRDADGFSNPANKQNHIARWLLAMHDVTKKPIYLEHARKWWQVMKSRMTTREGGKYLVWNYWDPAGPWDFEPNGAPRHWVGVHPNGGYYGIDVEGIVAAYEHGLVFTKDDLQRLIATNRDFMWNQQVVGAKFQRIDGGEPDARWKDSPGTLWTALVPYDETLKKILMANHNPSSWGGLVVTPWFLARERHEGAL
jgi:hypothetical protein